MVAVVTAALGYLDYVIFDPVDQTMLVIDAPAPPTSKIATQRLLWFAQAGIAVALDVRD